MERRSWVAGLVAGALFAAPVVGAAGWWAVGRLDADPSGVVRRLTDRLDGERAAMDAQRRAVEVERDALRRQLAKVKFAETVPVVPPGDMIPPQKLPTGPAGE